MAFWKNYHTPGSAEEAVELLSSYGGRSRVIGGGTDLLLELQQGRRAPVEALVDLSRIPGLNAINEEDGWIVIGAAVCHRTIVSNPVIQHAGTCLAEGCGVIGGPQVRNVGTLAGNLAHALPAGDGTLGFITLGGEIEIVSSSTRTWAPAESTFLGPGKSGIDPTSQVITRLRFRPTASREGSAFRRVMRPQGVALPMIGMAARISLHQDLIASSRICIGPAGPVPFLATEAMTFLQGRNPDEDTFREAAVLAAHQAELRDSRHRATAEYRYAMILNQLPLTLAAAAERAAAGDAAP